MVNTLDDTRLGSAEGLLSLSVGVWQEERYQNMVCSGLLEEGRRALYWVGVVARLTAGWLFL